MVAVREEMLSVRGLQVRVPGFALNGLDLTVYAGEYFVLLGPTGSGKTMFIETLCGLRRPDAGGIQVAGADVTYCDPSMRGIGYVPQDYALIPFKTVAENIAFGLEARRLGGREVAGRVAEMLGVLGIAHLADRYPARLSGGECQRVALARALAVRPRVLLLDEPFSAIDEGLREDLGAEVLRVHRQLGTTTIHISHSIDEALRLGDRLAILRKGTVAQVGTPAELVAQPQDLFVARFMRLPNLVRGQVHSGAFWLGDQRICPAPLPTGPAFAHIPCEAIRLEHHPGGIGADDSTVTLAMVVAAGMPRGYRAELRLTGPCELVVPGVFSMDAWPVGCEVRVSFPRSSVRLWSAEDQGGHPCRP